MTQRWRDCVVGAVGIAGILDEDTSEQINELATLRDTHETRLKHLLLQQAGTGRSTAVEINIEIEEIQVKVGHITADISRLLIGASRLEQKAARTKEPNDLADISTQIEHSSVATNHTIHTLIALFLKQQDADAPLREQRQRITIAFYVVISLLVAADLLARLFLR